MKKTLPIMIVALGVAISQQVIGQNVAVDHEGNEYEYMKMNDGRNWLIESVRAKTNIKGEIIRYFYNPNLEDEDVAAFETGFAYLRKDLFGSGESDSERTYTTRTQGLCPKGFYVPEWIDEGKGVDDVYNLISSYGGTLGWWVTDANWGTMVSALRLNANSAKIEIDPTTYEIVNAAVGQLHMHTSGRNDNKNPSIYVNLTLNENWGGIEPRPVATDAAYCRCIENFITSVSFSDFEDGTVIVSFSEPLRKNNSFGEEKSEICAENFLIVDVITGDAIPVETVFGSDDKKEFALYAEGLKAEKIYELTIVDPRMRGKGQIIPYGGYTFNGGKKLYFPKEPTGINPLEHADIRLFAADGFLNIALHTLLLNARIYSTQGVCVMSLNNLSGDNRINISSLAQGVYAIRFEETNASHVITRKFFVK